MYDREPRVPSFIPRSEPMIGPGTYELVRTFENSAIHDESYAPFNSLAPSRPENPFITEVPGPGEYNLAVPMTNGMGCGSLKNRAKRFPSKGAAIPGPGAYDIEVEPAVLIRTKRSNSTNSRAITYVRKMEASSIPHPRFAYGFEEDPSGSLVAQKGPAVPKPLGPGSYNTTKEIKFPGQKYHGITWQKYSRLQAPRDLDKVLLKNRDLPGPAEYSSPSDHWQKIVLSGQIRNAIQSERLLNVPRFTDSSIQRAKKDDVPGPGNYNIGVKPEPLPLDDELITNRPPFNVQDRYDSRFKTKNVSVPGPGAYNDPRTGIVLQQLPGNTKSRPFNTSSSRFANSKNAAELPGRSLLDSTAMSRQKEQYLYSEYSVRIKLACTECLHLHCRLGRLRYDSILLGVV
ncbi:Sperm-tail PG-rich repeat-containing protein 2 [Cichlidogyrus casuarinus]|uniref:Sperm-tail PG-rich repeat-containing protein 2 n=1 Tax=Cichlidogyrus casuarinus TaxID=1844966 RepID=A0ABD2QHS7_9PLAT